MKDKLIDIWYNDMVPFLKAEHGFKTWVVLAVAFASFVLGAVWF